MQQHHDIHLIQYHYFNILFEQYFVTTHYLENQIQHHDHLHNILIYIIMDLYWMVLMYLIEFVEIVDYDNIILLFYLETFSYLMDQLDYFHHLD